MQVTEIKNQGLEREYKIIVNAADIEKKVDARLEQLQKNAKAPGFRAGKVPLSIVKKKHGTAVLGEVLEQIVSQSSQKLFKEKDIRPALQPKIEITSFDEGKDLEFTACLEVFPQIPDIKWDSISLEEWKVESDEKNVEEGLTRLLENHKQFVAPAKARAAKKGDVVVMDFVGTLNGVAFDGGTAKGFRVEIGSGSLIPGFEDQLIGANVGDEPVVKVKFPENYGSKELAGKDAEFAVTVNEILESKAADATDEFAKSIGFESIDKLKEAIKEHTQKDYDNLSRTKLKKELFDNLDEKYKFAIPEGMIKLEFDSLWSKVESARKSGQAESDKPEAEQKAEMQKMAERRVRLGIVLAETGRSEKVEVKEEEIRRAMIEQAMQFPGQEQQVLEYYRKHPHALEEFRGPIIEEKVVDLILTKVKKKEKKVSLDDLKKYLEQDN